MWTAEFNSLLAPGADYANDIALDHLDNVYVTGTSINSPNGYDFLTAKYAASGKQLWTARYNGETNLDEYAVALAVDAMGNVYVTGSSTASDGRASIVTVKYDTNGVEQWAATLHEPNADGSNASALAVDPSGNVYVTGWNSGAESEYLTVKYDTQGVEQWRARYGRSGFATMLAVDPEGNVLVAGGSDEQQGHGSDFVTVKYNAAGNEQWAVRYDGPAHGDDVITGLGLDAFGNIYVMGVSRGEERSYALAKYDNGGLQKWVERFGSASDSFSSLRLDGLTLAVDSAGNCYAARGWEEGYEYRTIKYGTDGTMQWTARYNRSEADHGAIVDVALDHAGNVLVTGFTEGGETEDDYTTVKYNANGVALWAAHYNGPQNDYDYAVGLAIDGANNIYVTGTSYSAESGQDYATIKYNPLGQEQWAAHYNKDGNSNENPVAMTMDTGGNIYVTGSSEAANTAYDYITIKYNRDGVQEWIARYDGPAHGYDVAAAIAVDNSGNVYITGSSANEEGSGRDYATIKYNVAGIQQWVSRYRAGNTARALAVDPLGNVYVTGSGDRDDPQLGNIVEVYATVKYNVDGVEQWGVQYQGPGEMHSYASAIAVDGIDNVYVTGGIYDARSFATLKYNAEGRQQWIRMTAACCGGPAPIGLAIDGKGNIYMAGSDVVPGEANGVYKVVKYNPDGREEWTAYHRPSEISYAAPTGFAVDVSGNVYVTGRSFQPATFGDYAIVKFNTMGERQWAARYNGTGNGFDYPSALAVDGSGNVYVIGSSFGAGTGDDYATVKYNTDGVEEWVVRYNSSSNIRDWGTALVVDNWGDVYVTGKVGGYSSGSMTTIKYAQQENGQAPREYSLSQRAFEKVIVLEFLQVAGS